MKSILMIAFAVCISSAVLFANKSIQANQVETTVVQEELVFNDIAIEKVPVKVIEAFGEDNKDAVIAKAAVATTAEETSVYRISVKDTQGESIHYFYNEDGSKFEKEESLEG
ncbi:hypothetical protein SAMN06265379_102267 [Saccharicrinis carchari]|uniref:Beta-lactamase-inhibitor-like, PepSY-like n=1 Tax=Saccharicrinis carchari TaxID=1168039 RepID=A0A521C025_SACCC|nr:hypothetical protein [Saccharicrinis carchari]SMO52744.1 hypothetical protein SAMN06265379_102267 [Saccharicrinis carchari]